MPLSATYLPRGSGEAPRAHSLISTTFSHRPLAFLGVFRMSSPNSPALQRLHRLDRSSPDFCDQLRGVLYEQEYVLHEKSFEQNDLEWLIDYLDEVHHDVTLLHSPLKPDRFSTASILPPQLPASAYVNSEVYAALG